MNAKARPGPPPMRRFKDAAYRGYGVRLRAEPDEELTRVGPGTPCGEYLRRFWHPVALSSDLDLPVALTILGEELVVFRDGDRPRPPRCPHLLEYGSCRPRGIRCCYHGTTLTAARCAGPAAGGAGEAETSDPARGVPRLQGCRIPGIRSPAPRPSHSRSRSHELSSLQRREQFGPARSAGSTSSTGAHGSWGRTPDGSATTGQRAGAAELPAPRLPPTARYLRTHGGAG